MELLVGTVSALYLGILTSISPCPLATNIAAISYIGRKVSNSRLVLLSGLLYTVGRTLAYLVLGMLLATLLTREVVSSFGDLMNQLLGPILILVAMFLLEMIGISFGGSGISEKMQKRVDALGVWGALPLGVVFALTFCPTSFALFFLALIPLAVKLQSSVLVPGAYGIGTALPVVVFAVFIALSTQLVGKAFNRLSQIEWWVRRITGVLFLLIGIYFTLKYVFFLDVLQPLWGLVPRSGGA